MSAWLWIVVGIGVIVVGGLLVLRYMGKDG
jgi:hypothetical protein